MICKLLIWGPPAALYLDRACALSLAPPPGFSQKSSNFKPVSRTLKNQKKCPQGHQKTPKCDQKLTFGRPGGHFSVKNGESDALATTPLGPMFSSHSRIRSPPFSSPKSPRIRTGRPERSFTSFLDPKSQKITKLCPKWVPGDSPNPP